MGDLPETAPRAADGDTGTLPELYCAHCGYDLRGTVGERCSECGKVFDRAAAQASRIAWVHRRELGRIRAYWRTLVAVSWRPWKLAEEMARPVDWRSASRFRWVMIGIAAVLLAGLAGVAELTGHGHFADLAQLPELTSAGKLSPAPILWPALVLLGTPWFLVASVLGCLLGLAMMSWWARTVAWVIARTQVEKEQASSLVCYVTTPGLTTVAVIGLGIACVAATSFVRPWNETPAVIGLALMGALLVFWWWLRVLILTVLTTRIGLLGGVVAGALLLPCLAAPLVGIAAVSYPLGLLVLMWGSL
jgi:hypothetical protein